MPARSATSSTVDSWKVPSARSSRTAFVIRARVFCDRCWRWRVRYGRIVDIDRKSRHTIRFWYTIADRLSSFTVYTRRSEDAQGFEGDRLAGRGHGADGGPLRGARRLHGGGRVVPRGCRCDSAGQRAARRPLPEPALGLRGPPPRDAPPRPS